MKNQTWTRTLAAVKDDGNGGSGGGPGPGKPRGVRLNFHGGVVIPVGGLVVKPPPPGPMVLVTGGIDFSASRLYSAELFDIDAVQWGSVGNVFSLPRSQHTATFLPTVAGNGVVLAGGIQEGSDYLKEVVDFFNEARAACYAVGPLLSPQIFVTATLLETGKLLVVGDSATCELFDPQQLVWTLTASLNVARQFHTATFVPGPNPVTAGEVLVVGGGDLSGTGPGILNSVELYDQRSPGWRFGASLPYPLESHTASLGPNRTVLVAGGFNFESGGLGKRECLFYERRTDTWSQTTPMNKGRTNHTATTLSDGRVLVVGGMDSNGVVAQSAEIFDFTTATWTEVARPTARVGHTTTLLPDGRVLVAGGAGRFASCQIYNPSLDVWEPGGNLNTNRAFHTATLLETMGNPFSNVVITVEGLTAIS
jgi:hypothetical protein